MAAPTVAVAVTKATDWHGKREEFDNVYYYSGPAYQAGDANYLRLAEAIVAAEKLCHGSSVEFIRYRIWSAGGTKEQNVTLALVDLDGFGNAGSTPIFRESAAVVEWETDRANVLGRKVYLRKFIRVCSMLSSTPLGVGQGTAPIPATDNGAYLKTYADTVDRIVIPIGAVFNLVTPSGREVRAADNGVVNEYMRSREFRRN